jgi:sporulation protein YlmC with PRC-barrel domain
MKPLGKIGISILAAAVTLTAQAQTRDNWTDWGRADRTDTRGQRTDTGTFGRSQEGTVQRINRASDLVGMEVRNYQDERIGRIDEIVIDFEQARVGYAVVSVGGFLGLGDRKVALPLHAFQPGREGDRLFLDATRDQLERAQDLNEQTWPRPDAQQFPATRFLGSRQQYQQEQYRTDVFREDRFGAGREWQEDRYQTRQPQQQQRYQDRMYEQDRFDTRQPQQRTDRFQQRDQDFRQPGQQQWDTQRGQQQWDTQPGQQRQLETQRGQHDWQQQQQQRRTDRFEPN